MTAPFEFKLQTRTSFGPKSLQGLSAILRERNARRIAVIIDVNVAQAGYWQEFHGHLSEEFTIAPYFLNEQMEPSYDYLDEVRDDFTDKVDCLIGVGGGSTLDLAKAVSVLVTNKEKAIVYRGHGLIKHAGIPLILIPSTAGSGSEITPFAVFTDTQEQRKFGINSPVYLPIYTIIDPMLTLSCPPSVTVSSGMDALTHTLESFVARKHTPLSRVFSQQAFSLLYNNLPRVLKNPEDIELRSKVSLGAYYAGIALFNSAAGPAGVLSYPIGTLFGVTHGMAGAVFLSAVVQHNVEGAYRDYEHLYDLIENAEPSVTTAKNKSELFLAHFSAFCNELEIPTGLHSFGVSKSDIPTILEHLRLLWGAVEQNPVDMSEKDIKDILVRMLP